MFGITAGCLLGMLPLLFMKDKKEDGKEDGGEKQNNQSNEPTTATSAAK